MTLVWGLTRLRSCRYVPAENGFVRLDHRHCQTTLVYTMSFNISAEISTAEVPRTMSIRYALLFFVYMFHSNGLICNILFLCQWRTCSHNKHSALGFIRILLINTLPPTISYKKSTWLSWWAMMEDMIGVIWVASVVKTIPTAKSHWAHCGAISNKQTTAVRLCKYVT